MTEMLFWCAAILTLVPYVLYPVTLYVLEPYMGRQVQKKEGHQPSVSVIVAAANEERLIKQRIENILEQHYPQEQLEIIIVSDCSLDNTDAIVKSFSQPNVTLIRNPVREGKSMAQNVGVAHARGEVIMFTDADTLFEPDYLQKLMRNFSDPSVGAAHGKIYFSADAASTVTKHIGVYMAFELWLRGRESSLGILLSSTGANTAVRRTYFRPVEGFASEDVTIPLDCAEQHARTVYDPEAVCHDVYFPRASQELSFRIRSTVRAYCSLMARWRAWHPVKHPVRATVTLCHRFLRYICPFMMLVALAANACLLDAAFFRITFTLQILFYAAVLIEPQLRRLGLGATWLGAPFNFCLVNAAFFVATLKAMKGTTFATFRDRQ